MLFLSVFILFLHVCISWFWYFLQYLFSFIYLLYLFFVKHIIVTCYPLHLLQKTGSTCRLCSLRVTSQKMTMRGMRSQPQKLARQRAVKAGKKAESRVDQGLAEAGEVVV